MRNILFILLAFCFILNACGKKEDSAGIKPGLVCEISGRAWSGDTISYVSKTSDGEFYSIVAPKGNVMSGPFEGLTIYLKGELKVGEYKFENEGDVTHAEFNSNVTKTDKKSENDYDAFRSSEGKVNITKVDESHAEGNFNCTLVSSDEPKKTLKVTNGKFNLKILK